MLLKFQGLNLSHLSYMITRPNEWCSRFWLVLLLKFGILAVELAENCYDLLVDMAME